MVKWKFWEGEKTQSQRAYEEYERKKARDAATVKAMIAASRVERPQVATKGTVIERDLQSVGGRAEKSFAAQLGEESQKTPEQIEAQKNKAMEALLKFRLSRNLDPIENYTLVDQIPENEVNLIIEAAIDLDSNATKEKAYKRAAALLGKELTSNQIYALRTFAELVKIQRAEIMKRRNKN